MRLWTFYFALLCYVSLTQADEKPQRGFRELQRHSANEAHQAVAVDETSFFAIASREIARYQKSDGKLLEKWKGAKDSHIRHLNSACCLEWQTILCPLELASQTTQEYGGSLRRQKPETFGEPQIS